MSIKRIVSGILGFHIGNEWDDVWRAAEIQGKLTGAKTNLILLELCKKVEQLEKANEVPTKKPSSV